MAKNNPQGINPTELLLTLVFGNSATSEGTVFFSVHFNQTLNTTEQYKTVLVVDDNGRTIAMINNKIITYNS